MNINVPTLIPFLSPWHVRSGGQDFHYCLWRPSPRCVWFLIALTFASSHPLSSDDPENSTCSSLFLQCLLCSVIYRIDRKHILRRNALLCCGVKQSPNLFFHLQSKTFLWSRVAHFSANNNVTIQNKEHCSIHELEDLKCSFNYYYNCS